MTHAVPDIPFLPTPPDIVDAMLDLARVTGEDVVFDLGSGDGRIAIAAARRYGARAAGVELSADLVRQSTAAAEQHGVAGLTTFRLDDFFAAPLAGATVVTLYLLPSVNLMLRPKLLRELAPGARVVSHAFHMGDWMPSRQVEVSGRRLYVWIVGDDSSGHRDDRTAARGGGAGQRNEWSWPGAQKSVGDGAASGELTVGRNEYPAVDAGDGPAPAPPSDAGAARPASTRSTRGVNVAGYAMGELGLGEDVRAAASAMAAARVPFCVYDVPVPLGSRANDRRLQRFASQTPLFDVNLICLPASDILRLLAHAGPSLFAGRYNVAGMQWELPRLPAEWHAVYSLVDELWAPSRYVEAALRASQRVPVIHIPPAVDIAGVSPCGRQEFGISEGPFLFLAVFDGFSTFSRKNPTGVVEAFGRAFVQGNRDVRLVVKCMNGVAGGDEWSRLRDLAAADDRVTLIDEVFDRPRLLGLLNCCDCYVSLHRAEGFGRVLAEAMLLGKPVIATNHSGNTDFTRAGTAFLVEGSLVAVRPSEYFGAADQYWCDPDVDHAAAQMQCCFRDDARRRALAEAGQAFIRNHHNLQVVGARYRARLAELALL